MTPEESNYAASVAHNAYNEGYDKGYAEASDRIKELEAALKLLQSAANIEAARPGPTFCDELKEAMKSSEHFLNKKS